MAAGPVVVVRSAYPLEEEPQITQIAVLDWWRYTVAKSVNRMNKC